MSNTFDSNSVSSDDRTMAAICHIVALIATSLCLNWLVPIVVMFTSDSPFVKQQAKEALNFQISIIIWAVICVPLCFLFIGIPMLFVLVIAGFVLPIIAALTVGSGTAYRYPWTFRLVK